MKNHGFKLWPINVSHQALRGFTVFLLMVYASLCFLPSASLALPYILAPGDVLEVKVLNNKDMNTKQEISSNGNVSLPFLGRVKVSGMSLDEFELYVRAEFGKHIDKPEVVVYLVPRTIYVVQHHLKTDTYVYKECKTIEEARAYAGEAYAKEINYGDVIYVEVGTIPSWWDNNWPAIITATAVVIGIAVTLR